MRELSTVKYSQDLLNNLFRHPYTRIEYLEKELGVTRQTAARRLDALATAGLVEKHQQGRNNYYINTPLVDLLSRASTSPALSDRIPIKSVKKRTTATPRPG
jgi:DNA-binding IclR family transcriptional regulator